MSSNGCIRTQADLPSRPVDAAMHEAVAAIAACGVSPLVRIAANEGWMVKRGSSPSKVFLPSSLMGP